MDLEKENGAALDKQKFSQLILTFDREKFVLTLGGVTTNYNEAISMLQMATREFEAKIAAARVSEAMQIAPGSGFCLPFAKRH